MWLTKKFLILSFLFESLRTSHGVKTMDMVYHVGILYDEYYNNVAYNLETEFVNDPMISQLRSAMEMSFRSSGTYEPPFLNMTARPFGFDEPCKLINEGVRIIISLTSCGLAEYTTQITGRHHIVHLAIPYPICSYRPDYADQLTLWFQPDVAAMSSMLFDIIRMERAPKSLLLNNGASAVPSDLLSMSTQAIIDQADFLPAFAVQEFNTERDRQWDTERRYFRPLLNEVYNSMEQRVNVNQMKAIMEHAFVFAPNGGELEVIQKMLNHSGIAQWYKWIFGEPLQVPVAHLTKLIAKSSIRRINVGLIRYFPILTLEDCERPFIDKLLQETMVSFSECDTTAMPERVALAVHLIIISGHAIYFHHTDANHGDNAIICGAQPPVKYLSGLDVFNYMQEALVMNSWRLLHFYGSEKAPDGWTRFVSTASFEKSIELTDDGKNVARQAAVSGLFPNRFRNFSNAVLNVGIVPEMPYIIDYNLTEEGEVVNATGVIVDLLDLMSKRFNFRYRLLIPLDKTHGDLLDNGSWTGLIKDLQDKRIDLIGSCMSQTLDRSLVGRFIGLIDEDEVGMLMARSTTSGAAFETLGVFRPPVLLILAFCSSVGSILIYLVNWLSPYSSRNQQLSGADMFDSSLPEQCTIMLKACLGQNILFYPRAPSSRMLLMSFWMMVFLLFLGWKVDVAAFLTSNKVVYAINSFEELASSKTYIPLVVSGSGILGFLRDASLNPAYQGLYEEIIARVDSKGTTVNNITDGVKQVLDNPSNVLVGSYAVLKFIQQIQCSELVLAPQRVDQGQRALMTRKEMDWGPTMDKYLRRLKETGVINRIQTKWSNQMHVCSVDTTIFKPLSIAGINALLIMLAASLSLSFSALFIELLWVRFGEHVWSHFLARIWPNQRRG